MQHSDKILKLLSASDLSNRLMLTPEALSQAEQLLGEFLFILQL